MEDEAILRDILSGRNSRTTGERNWLVKYFTNSNRNTHMKINKITLLLLTIITLLGCEDESSDNNVFTKHPMSIGTSWTYEKIWTINTYKSPTSDSIISSYTTKINGTIRIDKDTIINKTKLLVFRTQEVANNDTSTRFQYFNMDKEGLKCYAYKNEEIVLPNIDTIGSNEIFIYNTPVLWIKYPLTLNSEWISDTSDDNGISITKKVIGTDTLLINNQKHACLKITYIYPSGYTNQSTTQWISKVGLLKEESSSGTVVVNPYKFEASIQMKVLSVSIK